MAVSGSVDFAMTVGEVINAALKKCGVGHNSETPTAAETNDAKEALDMILKEWSKYGLKLWQRRNQSITLVASQSSYTLGRSSADVDMDRPIEIVSAYRRDSNSIDTPLTKISKDEYRRLSD